METEAKSENASIASTRPDFSIDTIGDSRSIVQSSDTRVSGVREPAARDRRDERLILEERSSSHTALFLLGLPALAPIIFMMPSVFRLSSVTHAAGNDVLGTGAACLLFAMLSITPLITLVNRRWFVPLRRWYGIVFAFDIILDAVIAANDPAFGSNIQQDLTGHTFLAAGVIMVIIVIPLLITALHRRIMKFFGRYWRVIQAIGTYLIWGILGVHLLLLEGLKPGHSPDTAPTTVFHQRFYEYLACTIPLIAFRLPIVRRSTRVRDLITIPCLILFATGYVFFINELLFKGYAAYRLQPIND